MPLITGDGGSIQLFARGRWSHKDVHYYCTIPSWSISVTWPVGWARARVTVFVKVGDDNIDFYSPAHTRLSGATPSRFYQSISPLPDPSISPASRPGRAQHPASYHHCCYPYHPRLHQADQPAVPLAPSPKQKQKQTAVECSRLHRQW